MHASLYINPPVSFIHPSIYPFIHLSIHSFIHLSIYLSCNYLHIHHVLICIAVDMVNALSDHRSDFSHRQWTRLLGWGDPVGVNGFYAGWEQYCDVLRSEQSFDAGHSHHRHLQHQYRDRDSDSGGNDSMGNRIITYFFDWISYMFYSYLCDDGTVTSGYHHTSPYFMIAQCVIDYTIQSPYCHPSFSLCYLIYSTISVSPVFRAHEPSVSR